MERKNDYKMLGAAEHADVAAIKASCCKLAQKHYPDVNKKDNAEHRFKEVGESYTAFKDLAKRAEYDLLRK